AISRASCCGARRGSACTLRCKCGPRPGSVARALGVQSRAIRQVIAGWRSDLTWQPRGLETRIFVFSAVFLFFSLMICFCITPHPLRALYYCSGSDGTTAAALQARPFVTSTKGASLCVGVF
ncbi:unnamed protein product, partial [Laminaria digitata]